ncbi:sugar phosphate nucleotidyltransferase [Amylibacter sp.]|nr:sugar phosphate nucleotidyltransferase [Amylibacter sp.]
MLPVAILAGGMAKRLMPITETIPKALVQIADKPFIEHQLMLIKDQGITDVVICTGHLGEQIRKKIGSGKRFGLHIDYSEDGKNLRGTGGAIKNALKLLGDHFFVLYGDSYLPINFQDVQSSYIQCSKSALMTILKNENRWDKSNVRFERGKILEYNKHKPNPKMLHIDYGLGILSSADLLGYPTDKSFDLAEVYHSLSLRNDLAGYETQNRFYEIGSHTGLYETEKYLLRKDEL